MLIFELWFSRVKEMLLVFDIMFLFRIYVNKYFIKVCLKYKCFVEVLVLFIRYWCLYVYIYNVCKFVFSIVMCCRILYFIVDFIE